MEARSVLYPGTSFLQCSTASDHVSPSSLTLSTVTTLKQRLPETSTFHLKYRYNINPLTAGVAYIRVHIFY